MINIAAFTEDLRTALKEAPTLSDVKAVERGEYLNRDPAVTPWIGVYRTAADYTPRALGKHSKSWSGDITVKLVLQVYSENGEKAEDDLENLIRLTMDVVFSDLQVNSNVSTLKRVAVQYSYEETESQTMNYQWAFITLTYEARTGA